LWTKVDSEQVFGARWRPDRTGVPIHAADHGEEVDRMRARVLAIVLVVAGLLLIVPGLARGDGPEEPESRVVYVVEAGDTPWSIARRVAPGHDPRPVVDALVEANDLRGGLQVGQELSVPVPEH
jgi:LysM domain-containing protein